MVFLPVTPKVNFPELEKQVHQFWQKHHIFERSLEERSSGKEFSFYDGPPFATGLPHYGTLLHSITKDIVPRYWTMKGFRVRRRWGWDCHGLPIENLIEKELGIKSKKEIEDMGVATFNETCRSSVLRCASDWEYYVNKLGRWVDFKNDYKTMDPAYMESIWWVFKQLWDKQLIYEGKKSMHICPRCATPLSNFEVTLGYEEVADPSVVVKFPLVGEKDTFFLAWTTTPWTLPANLLLAVGAAIEYQKIQLGEREKYIVATDRMPAILGEQKYRVLETFTGKKLIGKKYQTLFEKSLDSGKTYEVVGADFVSTQEGSGIVHIAPAFGEDDLLLGQKEGAPFYQHISFDGVINSNLPQWQGVSVWESNQKVIEYLQEKNLLFHHEEYKHSYPHCWRCGTKLINYATTSWFVRVTSIKKQLIQANKKITWIPRHIQEGRFGEWLRGARDWAISRNRYWGTPLPVWRCTACHNLEVFGSIHDLENKCGKKINDLHKHFVDELTWNCTKCQHGTMQRIPEVLDCWFESGSMPYASMHYPFKNRAWFDKNFPADFIGEGIDQTRGWFYTLHVLAVALFGKPAFKHVICTGLVLAEDGQKMSKSKKNYPDPLMIIDKYGADTLRFYMVNSPVVEAEDLCFSEKELSELFRNFMLMLWNSYAFFITYATTHSWQPPIKKTTSPHVLDQWIISRWHQTLNKITTAFDTFQLFSATRQFQPFLNDLSKWYIRRSRDRFNQGDPHALATLYTILLEFSKLLAPCMPFVAETIYQNLTQQHFIEQQSGLVPLSVHLCTLPKSSAKKINLNLEQQMELVRMVAEAGNRARREAAIKVRQPLAQLTITLLPATFKLIGEQQAALEDLLQDELNVKKISWQPKENVAQEPSVILDTTITPILLQEGIAREMIRYIQRQRQKLGLVVGARVFVSIAAPVEFQQQLAPLEAQIKDQTGTQQITWEQQAATGAEQIEINGITVFLSVHTRSS